MVTATGELAQWLSAGAGTDNSRKNEGASRPIFRAFKPTFRVYRPMFRVGASPSRREAARWVEETQDGTSQGRQWQSCTWYYCERMIDIAVDAERQPGLARASSSISGKQETGRRAADQPTQQGGRAVVPRIALFLTNGRQADRTHGVTQAGLGLGSRASRGFSISRRQAS